LLLRPLRECLYVPCSSKTMLRSCWRQHYLRIYVTLVTWQKQLLRQLWTNSTAGTRAQMHPSNSSSNSTSGNRCCGYQTL
jgi:hypothetical protein